MARLPLLSFNEMASVSSIEALRGLYAQKGRDFPDRGRFLAQVTNDWRVERDRLFNEANQAARSGQKPVGPPKSLDIVVEGVQYSVYGIMHGRGPEYAEIFTTPVNSGGNWLFERNIRVDFSHARGYVEMQDHQLLQLQEQLVSGFIGSLSHAAYMIISLLPPSLRKSSARGFDLMSTAMPLRAWSASLPAYVEIGLREEKTPPAYTPTQRRSAYQAEFARVWKPGEPKKLLVGAAHTPEIEYFLENRVRDSRITDIAAAHIELLAHNPDEFMSFVYKSESSMVIRISLVEALGFFAGLPLFPIMLAKAFDIHTLKFFPNVTVRPR